MQQKELYHFKNLDQLLNYLIIVQQLDIENSLGEAWMKSEPFAIGFVSKQACIKQYMLVAEWGGSYKQNSLNILCKYLASKVDSPCY